MYDEEKDLNEEDLLEVLGGDDALDPLDDPDLLSIDDVIAEEDGDLLEEDEAY